MKRWMIFLLSAMLLFTLSACYQSGQQNENSPGGNSNLATPPEQDGNTVNAPESFVLIKGGTFQMGSPDTSLGEVRMKHSIP